MSNEELILRFQAGEDVFDQLVANNIGWIRKRAMKHSHYSLYEYKDLENYFVYLLYKMASKYNPERNVKFITFFANVIEKRFATMVTKAGYVKLERVTTSLNNSLNTLSGDAMLEYMDTLPSPHGNVSDMNNLMDAIQVILTQAMTTYGATIAIRYFVEGVNTEELAQEYGVTREATSKQVRKARKILAQELPKYGYQY